MLNHPNIVQFFGYVDHADGIILITELVLGSSLGKLVFDHSKVCLMFFSCHNTCSCFVDVPAVKEEIYCSTNVRGTCLHAWNEDHSFRCQAVEHSCKTVVFLGSAFCEVIV